MNNLLSLRENMFLKIKDKKSNSLYRCLCIKDVEVEGYQYSLRYDLQSEINYKKAILEVKKDQENSITISLYNLIEKVNFNLALLSSLGSETIIYKNIKDQKIDNKYQIIQNSIQKEEYFKYLIHKEEYSYKDYQDYYTEDSFGNSYSMFKKVSPLKITSNKKTDLFWEYKNILNNQLHIEVTHSKKEILFYQSKSIRRDNIKIVHDSNYKYKDYKNNDDLKSKYHTYI